MLNELHINNIAVIEHADIEFENGLNIMTGETGAGKSIVIDSLNAVLGSRTSREMIRSGADKGVVTAVFNTDEANDWLEENDIDSEDGSIIVQRKISSDGKSSCRVCGMPVTVAQLRELGCLLLDLHGQDDGRQLMDEGNHIRYLDSYGELSADIEKYKIEYLKLREMEDQLEKLDMDESERLRKIDELQYVIQELENANIIEGEEEEKTERRDLLHNSEKISEFISKAYGNLYENEINAGDLLSEATGVLQRASLISEELAGTVDVMTQAEQLVNDAVERISDFQRKLDFAPGEYDELETRLSYLKRLQRKYRTDEHGLIELLDNSKTKLDEINNSNHSIEVLAEDINKQAEKCREQAAVLKKKRLRTAELLERNIEKELKDLNMASVRFKIEISDVSGRDGLNETGMDKVRFLMAANTGENLGKITKVASGGELSRIMLAMKNVLAVNDPVDTMVFDEIDTGVSGIAAQKVGEKLSNVAKNKQVICVTHLPQIAIMADAHFLIEKSEEQGRTYTSVTKLPDKDRVYEIARLHGGENISDLTLASAEEQLKEAEKYKNSRS